MSRTISLNPLADIPDEAALDRLFAEMLHRGLFVAEEDIPAIKDRILSGGANLWFSDGLTAFIIVSGGEPFRMMLNNFKSLNTETIRALYAAIRG